MSQFLAVMARNIVDTAAYLLAYRGAPVAAIAAAILLARFAPADRLVAWARADGALRSMAGGAALGMTRPLARAELGQRIAELADRPHALVAYLATSHGLTVYYLLLTGPLLGKDVLLSHVVGLVLFVVVAAVICTVPGWPQAPAVAGEHSDAVVETRPSLAAIAASETLRAALLMLAGLLLGGAIAAWTLTGPRTALVELVGVGVGAQLANALLGPALSALTWMVPVTSLFVGTYLWKAGLAHAGLVAFLLATTFSPQRVRQYQEHLGGARARRLTAALVLAAVLAAMATAGLYAVTPLSINYKLIPEQMW